MRFLVREILGWMFLLLGIGLLLLCLLFVTSRQVVEASIVAFVGVIVFRTGVHFLKVAVAARIYVDSRKPADSRVLAKVRVPRS